MNWLCILSACAFFAVFAGNLRADDPVQKPARGEERDSKSKEARRTNGNPQRVEGERRREQLKNMTPEERAAKRKEIKERLEKRIAELRSKQTNATLTAQETRELERREQILKRFEQDTNALPRIERVKPVLTNAPVEKK